MAVRKENEAMKSPRKVSRRKFVGGAAASFSIPYIIPSGVLAAGGQPGANDRLVIGCIGVGGMGRSHVAPDTAALCDVDDNQIAEAKKKVTGEPFITKDYRRILDRKDIDAVFLGSPDHWHALQTVHACQAGKDVYCEKPACRTIEEGRAMINAARKYKRVVQIGSQGRSHPVAHQACQYVRNGMIGKVDRVEIWHEANWTNGQGQETTPPANLDWDMWLGPARWRQYNTKIAPFNFRWYMDFGGGFVRDRGAHAISIAFWLLDNDAYKGPITVEATGKPQTDGLFDVPVAMDVRWELKNRPLTITWTQPGPPRNGHSWGQVYHGDKDSLTVYSGDGGCDTDEKAKKYTPPPDGVKVYTPRSANRDATQRHRENWFECIKSRNNPVMDVEIGVRVITLGNIANIAYVLGRKLTFDTVTERFVDDSEANRMLGEPYRAPWKL